MISLATSSEDGAYFSITYSTDHSKLIGIKRFIYNL
ncbi:hypothetical protein CDCE8392_2053 [Corynebacterium diphtheriae CDCE 8392]|nr:hypothetical protein CDCE8392_2053 [Corynebacterium diphtheriae CDCE 8392]AEX77526.1 hypothetical protein CDHC02_2039 [Corynebacterium diphtheriae HC02]